MLILHSFAEYQTLRTAMQLAAQSFVQSPQFSVGQSGYPAFRFSVSSLLLTRVEKHEPDPARRVGHVPDGCFTPLSHGPHVLLVKSMLVDQRDRSNSGGVLSSSPASTVALERTGRASLFFA